MNDNNEAPDNDNDKAPDNDNDKAPENDQDDEVGEANASETYNSDNLDNVKQHVLRVSKIYEVRVKVSSKA
ncbi:27645_t:CDS:2 [Dentiscutata erythropus]|uniref:27645_t:CDS:1 n=1 Tax=Dentiscutata erythropus TaxID=1348616 RepID=A0A9N9G533_9GLOM|nr:27645_t:CDS:2 [Dentiscutata erythropus]